jgi:hypothetical protein
LVVLHEPLNSHLNNVARAHAKRFRRGGQKATSEAALPERHYISVWTASRKPRTRMKSAA